MATNYKGSGDSIDFPYIVQTGLTINAGSMIRVDVSGTDIVHVVSAVAESDNFFGVLCETLTGASTGVVVARRGIFRFVTQAAATGCEVQVGQPVWAGVPGAGGTGITVRGYGTTASTLTGVHPIGVCVWLNERDETATSVYCHVDIYPDKLLPLALGESGNATP